MMSRGRSNRAHRCPDCGEICTVPGCWYGRKGIEPEQPCIHGCPVDIELIGGPRGGEVIHRYWTKGTLSCFRVEGETRKTAAYRYLGDGKAEFEKMVDWYPTNLAWE